MNIKEIVAWHRSHPYGARDELYVNAVLEHVKQLWLANPHQRLGQLLANVSYPRDPFHLLDEEWADPGGVSK